MKTSLEREHIRETRRLDRKIFLVILVMAAFVSIAFRIAGDDAAALGIMVGTLVFVIVIRVLTEILWMIG